MALVGCLGKKLGGGMLTRHAIRAAVMFAVAGAICRFLLRYVETRWQIAAFWCAVLIYQLIARPALGRRISPASTALDLVTVTIVIIAMKVAIEGRITH